ncbi:valine--tRNA ligase [Rhodospirillaceae bacterium SYSU D60014]|uniref:valine--tRNA ligase n=1 Tax=Virgifigura deserti TaxID=2268457 RepID=UPI000E66B3BA
MLDKTFRPAEVEARQYALWEKSDAFAAHPESSARPYTTMMPPPNVTGSLHMGHALNHTLQDILIRYHRMRGFDALWQPGTDHAGIATQMVVERQLAQAGIVLDRPGSPGGSNVKTIGRDAFIEKVWEWKAQSGGTIIRQLHRLGDSADWSRERFTMDEGLSEAVRKVFVDLYKQGLIYRDKRLVNWDPKLHTAVSDLEVEQREVKGHLWHFRYPIEGRDGAYIVVATTRPETMLGDTAVAVHPDDERYKDLIGQHVILPLVGRRIPIVADLHADPETGSGAVKITPAHDFNDFEVGRRHDLERVNIFDENACLNENVPAAYRGLERYEARERIVADLQAEGLVERIDDHTLMLPYGDRSGVVIEPWLTDQWYVDAATLAKPAIAAVEEGRTKFVPQQWEATYFEWMRNIQPWCISRQIWWGHQIPAWYGPDGEVFVEMTEEAVEAAAAKHYGKSVPLRRDADVLDTWFSSGLWPFSTLGWPQRTPELDRYYPGDVLVTAFDIIFFWVARMMMLGLHFMGDVPFRTVYIHALVRDEFGQKMSKSKGNIIDPVDLIEKYGADALRFTLTALAAQGRDVKLSEGRVEGYRNFATKLWNAARFCQMNGCQPDPAFDPKACSQAVNRWIVGRVVETARRVEVALAAYRFNDAANALYHFIWHEFCDWHLEFAKPILTGENAAAKQETGAATAWALGQLLHLLHPFMPFLTEELWRQTGGAAAADRMLITDEWPVYPPELVDEAAAAEMDWVIRLITEVRAVRSEMNVPPAAQIPMQLRGADNTMRARLDRHRELILRLARLSSIAVTADEPPKGAVQIVVDEATVILPLAEFVDVEQEKARLNKEIAKLAADTAKIEKKLANEQFLAKAPPEVVDDQRERLAEAVQVRNKLKGALDRLAAM